MILINGPISRISSSRKCFTVVEEKLRKKYANSHIINPISLRGGMDPRYYLRNSIGLLIRVKKLYMLANWTRCKFSTAIYFYAFALGKEFIFEDDDIHAVSLSYFE